MGVPNWWKVNATASPDKSSRARTDCCKLLSFPDRVTCHSDTMHQVAIAPRLSLVCSMWPAGLLPL